MRALVVYCQIKCAEHQSGLLIVQRQSFHHQWTGAVGSSTPPKSIFIILKFNRQCHIIVYLLMLRLLNLTKKNVKKQHLFLFVIAVKMFFNLTFNSSFSWKIYFIFYSAFIPFAVPCVQFIIFISFFQFLHVVVVVNLNATENVSNLKNFQFSVIYFIIMM